MRQTESAGEAERALENIINRRETAPLAAARCAAETVKPDTTVVTLSYSSTVLATLYEAAQHTDRLIVGESRPKREGRRTAKLAASFGIPVTLTTDAGAAALVKEANLVLLGADAALEDGSAVNKTGSTALAATARFFECPCLFVTTESKIFPSGYQPEFAERAASELGKPIQNVDVSNVYFERIPAELAKTVTSENQALSPDRIRELAIQRRKQCSAIQG